MAGAAFLLTQLGTHAAQRYAERVGEHGLTPPQTGILRTASRQVPASASNSSPRRSGMLPSRVVALHRRTRGDGLVERTRDDADRRRNCARAHRQQGDAALRDDRRGSRARTTTRSTTALTDGERADAASTLLTRIADQQGLTPGVHPGYRIVAAPTASS